MAFVDMPLSELQRLAHARPPRAFFPPGGSVARSRRETVPLATVHGLLTEYAEIEP